MIGASYPSHAAPLAAPVGALAHRLDPLEAEASLQLAANALREEGVPALPVVQDGQLLGVVTEGSLVDALAKGLPPTGPIAEALRPCPATLRPYSTGAEALRTFAETQEPALVMVDDAGLPLGVLLPSHLLARNEPAFRPKAVGGMATPFGVYLTNGVVSAGAGGWALVATGATMIGLFLVASWIGLAARHVWPAIPEDLLVVVLPLFLIGLRSLPMTGIHAAEHMTVNAIERGEELNPEIVRRMPRVHRRCGTNLAVAAVIFLSLAEAPWTPYLELRLVVAALVTLIVWRPLGALIQTWITTRKPTERQVDIGIAAGRELLDKVARAPYATPTVGRRLLRSGMFHIAFGAVLTTALAYLACLLLNVPPSWRVI